MQAHRVHVAFDDQKARQVGTGAARLVERVQLAPLVKEHGLRGVQVLRLALVDDAAAEGDDAPAGIADREHEAVAEAVVVALAELRLAALALDDEAAVEQRLARRVVAAEALEHLVPGVRRVADLEALEGLAA